MTKRVGTPTVAADPCDLAHEGELSVRDACHADGPVGTRARHRVARSAVTPGNTTSDQPLPTRPPSVAARLPVAVAPMLIALTAGVVVFVLVVTTVVDERLQLLLREAPGPCAPNGGLR